MKKKLATRNFILISIALLLGLVFSFISFSLPFSNYIFKGFARSFNLGLAFSDGTSNTYELEISKAYSKDKQTAVKEAKNIIQNLVLNKYNDGIVSIVDDDKISVTVPDTSISEMLLLSTVEMKAESGEEAETLVRGMHIKKAEYKMMGTDHCVYIEFTKEGKKAYTNLCDQAVSKAKETDANATEGKIYIYFNMDYSSANEITVGKHQGNFIYLTSASKEQAKIAAAIYSNSRYEINLSTENEAVTTHAYFSVAQKVMVAVGVSLIVFGVIVFMFVRYRELGWLSMLGLLIYSVLNIMTLSLLNAFRLNLGGIFGLIAGYLLTFITIITLYEKCLNEFKQGKKLRQSFKSGYKKSLGLNIDIFACALILALMGIIFTNGNIFTFSLAMCFAVIYGALTSLLMMYGFMKMYLNINSTKPNKINFKEEVAQNEN